MYWSEKINICNVSDSGGYILSEKFCMTLLWSENETEYRCQFWQFFRFNSIVETAIKVETRIRGLQRSVPKSRRLFVIYQHTIRFWTVVMISFEKSYWNEHLAIHDSINNFLYNILITRVAPNLYDRRQYLSPELNASECSIWAPLLRIKWTLSLKHLSFKALVHVNESIKDVKFYFKVSLKFYQIYSLEFA